VLPKKREARRQRILPVAEKCPVFIRATSE
jgi:hypothetical protein